MDSREELAESRTELAVERTLLANERTFAGWIRTGLASVGIGLGFSALFQEMKPAWMHAALATIFVLLGMVVFWAANRRARYVHARLRHHRAVISGARSLHLLTISLIVAAACLLAAIWMLG